jgi:NAD(P)-dependent dehydrogenase (short-subunit alcohol dehydrogenase family)/acyl carrier protein
MSREEIKDRLLSVVSERTGYPPEMLALDADLESDLGIDSIKRVEIAGTLNEAIALPDGASLDIEQLTASRTLAEVIAALEAAVSTGAGAPTPAAAIPPAKEDLPFERGPAEEERIGRFTLQAASAPAISSTAGLASEGVVVIVDDETGVGEAMAGALAERGDDVLRIAPSDVPEDAEGASRLAERLRDERRGAKALVQLAALGEPPAAEAAALRPLLLLAQALREDLEAAAAAGGAAVLGATRLGGSFGVGDGPGEQSAVQGAIPGFLKTLAQEWPAVRVKAVDLSAAPPGVAAGQLMAELTAADGLVEVGYRDGRRTRLTLAPAPLSERPASEPIDTESVVLVTGGARGITAEVAVALAERHRPTLLLVGRTVPGDEGPETAGLRELDELRRALIDARRRAGAELTPALVERDCRRILREREVRDNLARLERTGARFEYLTCDVRDPAALGALIDRVYERYGRLDGVIHGAGLIEDRLVRDKQLDSLERVLATKAGAARTLAEKLRPDGLRFLVLFSSVSGRFGNRGQADYAAASEVLNKLAQALDRRWPGRVVSINWAPWRARGMVSPALEREFARRGVALIPVELGCRLMEDELRRGRKGEPEVVIGADTGLAGTAAAESGVDVARLPLLASATAARPGGDGVELLRTLDLRRDPYLDDHRVDGRPVLPFAVAMELMAEAAAASVPERRAAGLRDIRLLQGVTVDDDGETPVRIAAAPRRSRREVDVTIGAPDGGRRHYQAVVELGDDEQPEPGAGAAPAPLPDLRPFPMSVEDAYRDLLFHGPLFQGIQAFEGLDERGARALLRPSTPGAWLPAADGLEWLLDPVLLDSALQVQVVWARLQWDVTLLPAEIGAHARAPISTGAEVPGGELLRHELRIRPESRAPLCRADHWFYRSDGRLLATLTDVVGVGSRALNRLAALQA